MFTKTLKYEHNTKDIIDFSCYNMFMWKKNFSEMLHSNNQIYEHVTCLLCTYEDTIINWGVVVNTLTVEIPGRMSLTNITRENVAATLLM